MKNYTDVVIDDKVYTVGCEQDNAYMQELAAYVNDKLASLRSQKSFNKQPYGSRQALILMNLADDYLQMRQMAEENRKKYEDQEAEFYSLKREMVNLKLQLEQLRLQNQVLSAGISGSEEMQKKLMYDVVDSVKKEADNQSQAFTPEVQAKQKN